MIYLDGKYYVELKDTRYRIHPLYDNIIGETEETKLLRTQNQFEKITQIRWNQKVNKNKTDELEVNRYPKTKKDYWKTKNRCWLS